jgi:hypothetical protein
MSKTKAKFTLNPKSNEARELSTAFLRRVWLFKWTILLTGLLFALIMIVRQRDIQSSVFRRESAQTQAQVLSCTMEGGGYREPKDTLIDYNYQVGEQIYKKTAHITDNVWYCDRYPVGNWFPVLYNPSKPKDAYFDGRLPSFMGVATVYFGVLLTMFLYFSIVVARADLNRYTSDRQKRIASSLLLDGEIIEVDGGKHSEMVTVQYRFTTPTQKSLIGWTSAYRPDLKGHLPAIGTPILVLYMSDSDHHVL